MGAGADGWLDSFPPIHLHLSLHLSLYLVLHTDEELEASVGRQTGAEFWVVWRERGFVHPQRLCVEGDKDRTLFWQQPCPAPCEATALPWPCQGLLITLLCLPACPGSAFRGETFQSREKCTKIKNIFSFFAFPAAHVPFPGA